MWVRQERYCHAGPNHGPPMDRGPSGWVCDACHRAVRRLLAGRVSRLCREEPR